MSHQIDESVFRGILPEDIECSRSGRSRRLRASPSWWVTRVSRDRYVIRVTLPGVKLMPHVHPEDRVYTVISVSSTSALGNTSTARSCQTGVCHTYAKPPPSPATSHTAGPVEPPTAGSALICCSQPRGDIVLDL